MNVPTEVPTIVTERLMLRELEDRDAEALFAIHSHPDAMRYWSAKPWADIGEAHALLSRARAGVAERRALRWGIARRADDRLVGSCTLYALDVQNRRAEIGYILGREHWGQGFMSEALNALLDYAFGTMGLHRIEADTDPRNAASVRTLERLGFAREGLLRERWRVGEEISDTLLMGLLRRDWEGRG